MVIISLIPLIIQFSLFKHGIPNYHQNRMYETHCIPHWRCTGQHTCVMWNGSGCRLYNPKMPCRILGNCSASLSFSMIWVMWPTASTIWSRSWIGQGQYLVENHNVYRAKLKVDIFFRPFDDEICLSMAFKWTINHECLTTQTNIKTYLLKYLQ